MNYIVNIFCFIQLFPFTNGSYANKFELTDHYAIDLEDYEMKLTDLINEYRQYDMIYKSKCSEYLIIWFSDSLQYSFGII